MHGLYIDRKQYLQMQKDARKGITCMSLLLGRQSRQVMEIHVPCLDKINVILDLTVHQIG